LEFDFGFGILFWVDAYFWNCRWIVVSDLEFGLGLLTLVKGKFKLKFQFLSTFEILFGLLLLCGLSLLIELFWFMVAALLNFFYGCRFVEVQLKRIRQILPPPNFFNLF